MSPEDIEAMFGDDDEEDWELSDADIAIEVLEEQLRDLQIEHDAEYFLIGWNELLSR